MTREKLIEKAREFEKKNKRITWKPNDFPEDMSESSTLDELVSEGDKMYEALKEETRKVIVLDMEDKIKLQRFIKDLEQIANSYDTSCKDTVIIKNALYYLKAIEEKIKV